MARRDLVVRKMQGVQVGEATHGELQLIRRVVLEIDLLESRQVHELVKVHTVV